MTTLDAGRDMRPSLAAQDQRLLPPGTNRATASTYADYRARRHMPSLDGIRCLSILAVLWHHSPHSDFTPATRGFLGVDLFFVLSGFLITTLLLRERDANGSISLRAFYMRRTLRIFPLYYLVLFGQALWLWQRKSGTWVADEFARALPYYATYTSNWGPQETLFGHAWSLAVEEQFYLLWPPLLCFLGPARALLPITALLVVNQLLDFGMFGAAWVDFGRRMAAYSAIGFGVLLGIALHTPSTFARAQAIAGGRHFIWLPLLALAGLVCIPGDTAGPLRLSIHLAMVALVAAVVVPRDHALSGVLRNKLVVHIGAVSYGMYLLHGLCFVAVGRVLNRENDDVLLFFVLSTLLTWGVATVSFRTVEAFFLHLKTRFARPR
jgi:peptidoglycan/LPS O-acetylase OafA/YrhL